MPIPYKHKRSTAAGVEPTTLQDGEIAINVAAADPKIFFKDSANTVRAFSLASYASATHSHAASDVTSGTFDAARLPLATTIAAGAVIVGTGLGVSSGTVSVTYGTNSTSSCRGDDSRLSDTRTPTDGSVTTAKIANDAVTYDKLQNVSATDRLLGRSSAGSGDVEEITCTAFGRSLIDDADAASARSTLSVQPTASPAFTGTATVTLDSASSSTNPLLMLNPSMANNAIQLVRMGKASATNESMSLEYKYVSSGTSVLGFGHFGDAFGAGFCQAKGGNVGIGTSSPGGKLEIAGGQLLVTAGSASACGVAFSGDPDTGMFSPQADVLAFSTAGSERFRVASNGDAQVGGVNVVGLRYFDVRNTDATLNSGAIMRLITRNAANTADTSVDLLRYNSGLFAITNNDSGPIAINTGGSERVRVENDGVVKMIDVYGDTVGATNRDLFIDDTGKLGYVSSIRDSKTGITAIDDVSWLRDLTPVSFHYRRRNEDGTYSDEADGTLDYGLIAEEVEPVARELCFYDVVDGEPQLRGVHYSKLITPMLRYIQQLEARIAALEEKINA